MLLFILYFIVDDTDIVEAASQKKVHELDRISSLHVQQFIGLDYHEYLGKNKLCF